MPTITELIWDDEDDEGGNIWHMRQRHQVDPWEVREVLESGPIFLSESSDGPNPVYRAVGYTAAGRMLEVLGIHFQNQPHKGAWRTITALDARPEARKLYLRERDL